MVYIARHDQKDYNVIGRYGGRIDIPLNEEGIKQAHKLYELLKDIKFDLVFSSPLQ